MKTPTPTTLNLPVPDTSSTTRRGLVVMGISVIAFTVNTLLLKKIGQDGSIPPDVPLLFRAIVGAIVVLAFFQGKRPVRITPIFTDRSLILRGVTGLLGTAAYYWTVPSLGAGKATLICNTYVVFASVFAMVSLGEKLSLSRALWLGTAIAGIAMLVGLNGSGARFSVGWHELIALFGAVMAAWSVVLVRRLSADYSIGTIYLAQCLWILGPVAILAIPSLSAISGPEWILLLLAASAAGVGQLAMNEGYRCLDVTTGASLQTLWPVATTLGGWLLFDESFGALQWLGAGMILASIWRIATGPAKRI